MQFQPVVGELVWGGERQLLSKVRRASAMAVIATESRVPVVATAPTQFRLELCRLMVLGSDAALTESLLDRTGFGGT